MKSGSRTEPTKEPKQDDFIATLMKWRAPTRLLQAFTFIELLVIIAMLVVVVALLLPAFTRAKRTSQSICCNCNLKQVGLGFKTWAIDHTNGFPMTIPTNFGVTREYVAIGATFRHF